MEPPTPASSQTPPLDCLVIGAHPDDAELMAGGTLALAIRHGRRAGILDLTRGEGSTRGSTGERRIEAQAAAEILGLTIRRTLDLGDGDIANSQDNRRALVAALRELRPRLVITHWGEDRHPDHIRAHELVRDAAFLAGVGGFARPLEGETARWKVEAVAYCPGNTLHLPPQPGWIVDITEVWEIKLAAARAHATQFYNPQALEMDESKATYIASKGFWEHLESRSREWGHRIGATYGEPFLLDRPAHQGHPLVRLLMEQVVNTAKR